MYRVRREAKSITVLEGLREIYKGTGEEYLIYRASEDAKKLTVKKILDLPDDELLLALATSVRIPDYK